MLKRLNLKGEFDNPLHAHPAAWESGNVSIDEFTRVYRALRKTANKRIKRLENSRFNDSDLLERYGNRFQSVTELQNRYGQAAEREIVARVNELYQFLSNKGSTVTGQRQIEKDMIQTFQDRGLDFINKGNLRQFVKFMEAWRVQFRDKIYKSESAALLFESAIKKGIDPEQIAEDFNFWLENQKELDALPRHRNAEQRTSDFYRAEIEAKKRKRERKRKKG